MKGISHTKIIIFHIFILFILFAFWFALSLYFNSYDAFTIINVEHNVSNSKIPSLNMPLLKGKSINGEFTAQENHLGIVAIRFYTFRRINNDVVSFSIKEKDAPNWYYQIDYKTNQFQWDKYFTFGFPTIDNSLGKQYVFQITSLHGTKKDAITLSKIQPVLETKYQFDKSQILSNPLHFAFFIYIKFLNSISNTDFVISSLVYAIPFFTYLWIAIIWYIYRNHPMFKRLEEIHGTIAIILLVILLNILFVHQLSSIIAIYIILGVWLFTVWRYQLEGKVSFFLAMLLILAVPPFLALRAPIHAEQSAIWSFYFILFGVIQQFWELYFKPKHIVTLTQFLKKMNIFKEYN